MKHHFIINPAAGKGTFIRSLTERIHKAANAAGIDYVIYQTTAPGDAQAYVAATVAADVACHRFYACGGDGTLCEVVNGAPVCPRAEFAAVPIGTGNDFCRNFSDRAAFLDMERQIKGAAIPIDLIKYNDRYCVNMLNVGFDCHVVERTVKFKKSKLIPSSMAYTTGVVATLLHKMHTKMHIELSDGEVIDRPLLLMSIANGQFYGGGYHSNPRAVLNDGLFDLNIIEKVSRGTFLSLIGSYKAGTHLVTAAKYITYRQATAVTLHFDEETAICADGELETATDLSVSLVPSAAAFVLPQGVTCLADGKEEADSQATEEAANAAL
ncbi:MAG: YegS/Rv2252/BmrU family lipid kinase [Clostridia bacterium]|nr:YegS/Rv2252/BmrU family lipid kinase [Clostridia bacterium]